ncbi:MAG: hypothetical protein OHK0052_12560 [Anaerolineales bacterium]
MRPLTLIFWLSLALLFAFCQLMLWLPLPVPGMSVEQQRLTAILFNLIGVFSLAVIGLPYLLLRRISTNLYTHSNLQLMGLNHSAFGILGHRFWGKFQNRFVRIFILPGARGRGNLLDIYLDVPVHTRLAFIRHGPAASCRACPVIPAAPQLPDTSLRALDRDYLQTLLNHSQFCAALNQLPGDLYLLPGRLWLHQRDAQLPNLHAHLQTLSSIAQSLQAAAPPKIVDEPLFLEKNPQWVHLIPPFVGVFAVLFALAVIAPLCIGGIVLGLLSR